MVTKRSSSVECTGSLTVTGSYSGGFESAAARRLRCATSHPGNPAARGCSGGGIHLFGGSKRAAPHGSVRGGTIHSQASHARGVYRSRRDCRCGPVCVEPLPAWPLLVLKCSS